VKQVAGIGTTDLTRHANLLHQAAHCSSRAMVPTSRAYCWGRTMSACSVDRVHSSAPFPPLQGHPQLQSHGGYKQSYHFKMAAFLRIRKLWHEHLRHVTAVLSHSSARGVTKLSQRQETIRQEKYTDLRVICVQHEISLFTKQQVLLTYWTTRYEGLNTGGRRGGDKNTEFRWETSLWKRLRGRPRCGWGMGQSAVAGFCVSGDKPSVWATKQHLGTYEMSAGVGTQTNDCPSACVSFLLYVTKCKIFPDEFLPWRKTVDATYCQFF
jgi:hypothetical protein